MPQPPFFQEISLAAVDLEDHAFVVPGGSMPPRLLASIREVGLLNPPWLRARTDRRWQVVAGLKRFKSVAQLGWESVPAHPLPASTPDFHCLLVGLYDNAFSRSFHLWEQATLARRLVEYRDRDLVSAKYLPYLGLPPSPAYLERLLQVSALESPLADLCAQGRLALHAAAALAAWPAADRLAARPFLAELPFSQSKQEQFLEDLEILSRREAVPVAEILSRPPLRQSLANPDLNPHERAEAVRQCLRRWVNPRLSAAREAFQEVLSRLGLKGHPRVRLQPPPAFEGPDFQMEIKFRDAPELKALLQEIVRITGQEDFSSLDRR